MEMIFNALRRWAFSGLMAVIVGGIWITAAHNSLEVQAARIAERLASPSGEDDLSLGESTGDAAMLVAGDGAPSDAPFDPT